MSERTIFGGTKTGSTRVRAGYALVELMVVISVNGVLMAVAVGLLAALLRTEHQGRRHFERTSGLVRLADQWRSDVAASRTAEVVDGAFSLRNGPSKIAFFRDGDRLRRVEYRGPAVVQREAYVLSDLTAAEFSVSEAQVATLRLAFGDDQRAAHDVWQIEARLARDGRFATKENRGDEP